MAKKKPKKIYYNHYLLYSDGTVQRIKPGRGTHVGRVLMPYTPNGSTECFVKLSREGIARQFTISQLLNRHF